MSKDRNKPRLGRGLSALLSMSDGDTQSVGLEHTPTEPAALGAKDPTYSTASVPPPLGSSIVTEIPIESIQPNPHQPRRDFNESSLAELAASLKSTGLVQPIVVRQVPTGYELIAGERRLRAAKLAGLTALPAIVRTVDAPTQAQMALVENIQREDLNPIDRAQAYQTIIETLGLTQGELAIRLGQDRSSIGHFLRLLDLAEPVREAVRHGNLSMGHAKLLVGVTDQAAQQNLAQKIVSEGLSVRTAEKIIGDLAATPEATSARPPVNSSAHLKDLEQTFTRHLGMKVQIRASSTKGRGKLIIQYKSLDEFDSLKDRLGIETD